MNRNAQQPDIALGYRVNGGGFFSLDREKRRRHLYTIGSTGAGKTTFLQSMILQDIHAGRGVCVIDPHGDLAQDLVAHIPRDRVNSVIYLDASDRDFPIGFNPLSGWKNDQERELVASQLVSTFKSLWGDGLSDWGEYLLKNTLMALLMNKGSTVSLLSVVKMFEDPSYRSRIVGGVTDPVVKDFWEKYFNDLSAQDQMIRVSSVLNKAGRLVLSPVLRNIFGQTSSGFDMREVMDEGKILIVNLSKGVIGEDNANLLGSILVSDIVARAMQRAAISEADRQDFFLYIDEFQNFTTSSFASVVSEARKYRLSLHLAHQTFDQIDPKVLSAIIKNTGTLAAFTVNFEDAERLVHSFRPIQSTALSSSSVGEYWCRSGREVEMVQGFAPEDHWVFHRNSKDRVIRNVRREYARPRSKVEENFHRWWQ